MKPIVIRNFHKKPLIDVLYLFFGALIFLPIFVLGISAKNVFAILLGGLYVLVFLAQEIFLRLYGIRITSKTVTIINQQMRKVFCYDDIVYLKIVFERETIRGEIKLKSQKTYSFLFRGINLGGTTALFPRLSTSKLRLTKSFVEKSIRDLSACDKVRIQNLYDQNS